MPPRTRQETLERLAQSVEKALAQSLPDRVTRTGVVLSPYYSKRLHDLIGELSANSEKPT